MGALRKVDLRKPKDGGDEYMREVGAEEMSCLICGENFENGTYWHGTIGLPPTAGYAGFCPNCVSTGRLGDFIADAMLASRYPHHVVAAIDASIEQTRARAWECAARQMQREVVDLKKEVFRAQAGLDEGSEGSDHSPA
jgi:hypothetical protein